MSLYPGPVVSQEYASGRDEGYTAGEHDAREIPANVHDVVSAARHDAQSTHTRNERAYWLGWLRGYREAVK